MKVGDYLTVAAPFALLLAFALDFNAQTETSLERRIIETAQNVEYAVVPVAHRQPQELPQVVGSAFLINDEGYFITAAHVLGETKSEQLNIIRRQKNGSRGNEWFDLVEKDEQHDLALCKMKNFVARLPKSIAKQTRTTAVVKPFASLAISDEKPEIGRFIMIAGFPLGSWNPTVQLGIVAATEVVNPHLSQPRAPHKELLQISVSGNKGNSGSPVIDLASGRVIGVIIQEVVSTSVQRPSPFAQSSGIMLAAPARWIQELLERHKVKSAFHQPTQ